MVLGGVGSGFGQSRASLATGAAGDAVDVERRHTEGSSSLVDRR